MRASYGHHQHHHRHHGHHSFNPMWIIGGIIFLLLITNGKIGWILFPMFFFLGLPLLFKGIHMMSAWWREHEHDMRGEWEKHGEQWKHGWKNEWHQHKDDWKHQFHGGWGDHEQEKRKGGYRPDRAESYGEKPKNRPTYVIGDDGELVEFKDNLPPKRGDDGYDYV